MVISGVLFSVVGNLYNSRGEGAWDISFCIGYLPQGGLVSQLVCSFLASVHAKVHPMNPPSYSSHQMMQRSMSVSGPIPGVASHPQIVQQQQRMHR